MRHNPTEPLPASFAPHEFGLMTKEEFLDFLNPGGKYHPSNAYDVSLVELNPLFPISSSTSRAFSKQFYQQNYRLSKMDVGVVEAKDPLGKTYWIFMTEGNVRAVLKDGVFYHDRWFDLFEPKHYDYRNNAKDLSIEEKREVKYPGEYLPTIQERNTANFPVVLQRFTTPLGRFEIRSEIDPRPGMLDTLVILNEFGLLVAMASDEWGATLIRVAQDYRRMGFGKRLRQIWTQYNPLAKSGGFTVAGEATALSVWEARVRAFLANGWYSDLIRQERLSEDRYKQILASLPPKAPQRDVVPLPEKSPEKEATRFLVLTDKESFFVLYDAKALSEEPEEKHIFGYGFFRDTPEHGYFPFRLEYERPYAKLSTAILLQLARNEAQPLYVEKAPSDLVEWNLIEVVKYEDGYVSLKEDILDIPFLSHLERTARILSGDPYGEKKDRIHELAEFKWR